MSLHFVKCTLFAIYHHHTFERPIIGIHRSIQVLSPFLTQEALATDPNITKPNCDHQAHN